MTYSEAVTLRDALEAALLSGAGLSSVQIDGKTITYKSTHEAKAAISQLNRDILAYERRQSNTNPGLSRPRWR